MDIAERLREAAGGQGMETSSAFTHSGTQAAKLEGLAKESEDSLLRQAVKEQEDEVKFNDNLPVPAPSTPLEESDELVASKDSIGSAIQTARERALIADLTKDLGMDLDVKYIKVKKTVEPSVNSWDADNMKIGEGSPIYTYIKNVFDQNTKLTLFPLNLITENHTIIIQGYKITHDADVYYIENETRTTQRVADLTDEINNTLKNGEMFKLRLDMTFNDLSGDGEVNTQTLSTKEIDWLLEKFSNFGAQVVEIGAQDDTTIDFLFVGNLL